MARRARGVDSNPQSRFEKLRYDASVAGEPPPPDVGTEPEPPPDPRTQLLADPSRTIVARNTSPDVRFEASVNPYRGCEHACVYCLAPETPVLFADWVWRPLGDVRVGSELIGFDEKPAPGERARKLRVARVEEVWGSRQPALRIRANGMSAVASAEHRWLRWRDFRWKRSDQLRPWDLLRMLPDWLRDPRAAGAGLEVLEPAKVESIEPAGVQDLVDIQTSSGTFFAAGLATHNCYARPSHEYLGWSAGLDFETKILVKHDAPALLRKALDAPRWQPTPLAFSGVTDCYQPAERKLGITRRCLEVLAEYRNPALVITKSFTVTRDVDVLGELARHRCVSVVLSVTSLDAGLQRILEPRAAPPKLRLAAIERLAKAGIPVGVNVAPIIPGLTDHEIPKILEAAASAGAGFAGRVVLRLPHGVKELFAEWLEKHFPERKEKVLNRLRALHGGSLYDSTWSHRQRGEGVFADQIGMLFDAARRRAGLAERGPELSTAAFRRPGAQASLFD